MRELRETFVEGLRSSNRALPDRLGDLRALVGVRRFPSRVRCAVLAFDALDDAMKGALSDEAPNK